MGSDASHLTPAGARTDPRTVHTRPLGVGAQPRRALLPHRSRERLTLREGNTTYACEFLTESHNSECYRLLLSIFIYNHFIITFTITITITGKCAVFYQLNSDIALLWDHIKRYVA